MKRTLIVSGLAALTLAAGGVAVAQQTPQDPPRHARGDADGDGRVSKAEFVDGRVQRLTALDADRDGSVSVEEMQAGREARRAQAADRMFARLDADGNGAITRAEFDARRAERAEHRGEGRRGPGRRGGMRRGGHEGMGAARGERGPVAIAEAQTRADAAFTRMDVNGDGYLTAEDRQARREQRRSRRAAASE